MTTAQLEAAVRSWVSLMADAEPELGGDGTAIVRTQTTPEGILLHIEEYPYDQMATNRKVLVTTRELK